MPLPRTLMPPDYNRGQVKDKTNKNLVNGREEKGLKQKEEILLFN